MRTSLLQRGLGFALALTLVLAAPLTARAEDSEAQFTELTRDHVSIEKTEYEYTGEAIRPNVTVRVEETLLTLDKEYSLEYADNTEVGEGKVIVTGIATGGYTGTVEVPFSIVENEDEQEPVALEESHVKLDKAEFTFDGKAIEPAVTVTVGDKVLVKDTDYTLTFENNDKAGEAFAVVTAKEGSGYTGTVRVKFTIKEAPKAPEYTITKGNAAKWTLKSTKALSFTADGDFDKFVGVSVDGKRISDSNYAAKKGSTVITLKSAYLNTLKKGEHTITIHFDDGKAEGSFTVLAASSDGNPNTGDNIHLWAALLFVSLTGLIGAGYAFSKKIWK
ncbi:MAG: hypothetical protein SPC78_00655 [Candidatus Faecousia sp.]|nr:hypothetical protein [Candidatus Faecousia sp.]